MTFQFSYLPSVSIARDRIEEADAYLLGIKYSTERVRKVMDCHREASVALMPLESARVS